MVMEAISVRFRNINVGAVSFNTETGLGAFEYDKGFLKTGIELSPLHLPLRDGIYTFPGLDKQTFKGLPGMIADSLPDDFGNAVLDAWVASQGRTPNDITPLQRLQYTGKRGMGALEFHPATNERGFSQSRSIQIGDLVKIAQEILDDREQFAITLNADGHEDRDSMLALLSVGMSAGGARPKAVLAFNEDFTEVRSGQIDVEAGFTHYLMKFDGVNEYHRDKQTFGDPMGFGCMEYVYSIMAKKCGINMMPCKLLNEGQRRHFITQRFDRRGNEKIHVQTLNGLAHVNYKEPGSYSYAQIFGVARQLRLPATDAEQLFRRMVFNIVARNHDDHSKNFAFLMNENNKWQLAPAYDIAFSYKPGSKWVNSHWMGLNGKRDNFDRNDFKSLSQVSPMFTPKYIDNVIDEVIEVVSHWPQLAAEQGVPNNLIQLIRENLRLAI